MAEIKDIGQLFLAQFDLTKNSFPIFYKYFKESSDAEKQKIKEMLLSKIAEVPDMKNMLEEILSKPKAGGRGDRAKSRRRK